MTRPVRPITAKAEAGLNIYATVRDADGLYFDPATGLFGAAYAGVPLAETDTLVVLALPSNDPNNPGYIQGIGRLYSCPFPAGITAIGLYRVVLRRRTQTTADETDPPVQILRDYKDPLSVAYGRTIHPPDFLPVHGHYGNRQPPLGSTPDLSLESTRSLRHAWQMSGGYFAHDSVHPRRYYQGTRVGYTATTFAGRTCAFVNLPPDHQIKFGIGSTACQGYLLGRVAFIGRTFTLLASINVPENETGFVFSLGQLSIRKTDSGYALTYYTADHETGQSEIRNVDLPPAPVGWVRWGVTYTAGRRMTLNGVPLAGKAAALSVYCNGVLLYQCEPGTLFGTVFTLGEPYDSLQGYSGACAAYHENYQYHGRALTAAEIAQDALRPYSCYMRPSKFCRPNLMQQA